jgi:hypothetical protein
MGNRMIFLLLLLLPAVSLATSFASSCSVSWSYEHPVGAEEDTEGFQILVNDSIVWGGTATTVDCSSLGSFVAGTE